MADAILRARVDTIRRLARRGAIRPLVRVLEKSRAEDLAHALVGLTPVEQRLVFNNIKDNETAAELLTGLGEGDLETIVKAIPLERLVELLELMEYDDETDVISILPADIRTQVMKRIRSEELEQVEELLSYPEDSAGGIMAPVMFKVGEDSTCRQAIEALQQAEEVESVFYLYIENDANQLVGVTSLRNLLTHSPSTALSEFMTTEIMTVTPDVDQEEVAKIVSRYDLLAIPVVDEHRKLLGIITVDDVIDVIREEAAEDMMLMVGVHGGNISDVTGVLQAVKERWAWLLLTLFGGIGAAELTMVWEDSLAKWAVLAGFLPVVLGMGGNVGSQAATITVRGIALGRVHPRNLIKEVWKESRVGMLLGGGYGLLLGIYCFLRFPEHALLGVGVGISILAAMSTAAIAGTVVPLTLESFKVDPAVATTPFVTTLMDNLGVIIYFLCTTFFLSLM